VHVYTLTNTLYYTSFATHTLCWRFHFVLAPAQQGFVQHVLSRKHFTTHAYFVSALEQQVQPIADRVAKNLEITSKNFQFSTGRTRILMGFIVSTMALPGTNRGSHGQNSGSLKCFRNNLTSVCHPTCNRLYLCNMYFHKHTLPHKLYQTRTLYQHSHFFLLYEQQVRVAMSVLSLLHTRICIYICVHT